MPACALGRGLKTLPLRVAQQNASALAVAQFLEADSRVSAVWHIGARQVTPITPLRERRCAASAAW